MKPKLVWLVAIALAVTVLDQLAKAWIEANVSPEYPWRPIEGFFHITHARNTGAALGLGRGLPAWVFIALTVVALGFIASFYRRLAPDDRLSAAALGLIVGGAIGNLIDRVLRGGEVVDFLQFNLGFAIFPDFNFADSAIVIGVGLLMLEVVVAEAEQRGSAVREGKD